MHSRLVHPVANAVYSMVCLWFLQEAEKLNALRAQLRPIYSAAAIKAIRFRLQTNMYYWTTRHAMLLSSNAWTSCVSCGTAVSHAFQIGWLVNWPTGTLLVGWLTYSLRGSL